MLGSLVSSLSQRLVRTATMALMLSGAGMAGYSIYLDQYAPPGSQAGAFVTFFKDNAKFFLILGAVGIVVGGLLNFLMARRMQKQMMGGAGGVGGMPNMQAMQGMAAMRGMPPGAGGPGWPMAGAEVVKVRCPSCKSLELEGAAFCSKCGKPMA